MPDKKENIAKKTMLSEILALITPALEPLKKIIGEKKFEKRVKKAAKLLASGIKPAVKKAAPVKKAAKNKIKKAVTKKIPVAKKSSTKA